jgi:hypothetical protein
MTDKPTSTGIDVAAELGVPLTERGQPNLRDHKPRRFIHEEEARARGWSRFWSGQACRYGHQASRAVSNPHQCSDCLRVKAGEPPVYPHSKMQTFNKITPKAPAPVTPAAIVAPAPVTPPEPDAADQRFITALAESRNFATAAASAGTTVALVQARISCNAVFRDAVNDLTERLQIQHPVPVSGRRELTPEEHEIFCRTWVDTGSQSKARAAIGITASQMHDELGRSPEFREMFEVAAPRAALALDDTAVDLSLAGNDKLLSKTLPAKLREQYTERMNLNMHVSGRLEKMTNDELSAELVRVFKQLYLLSPRELEETATEAERLARLEQSTEVIDVECTAVQCPAPTAEDKATRDARAKIGAGTPDKSFAAEKLAARSDDSNGDLL